jgi:hypothetical protein
MSDGDSDAVRRSMGDDQRTPRKERAMRNRTIHMTGVAAICLAAIALVPAALAQSGSGSGTSGTSVSLSANLSPNAAFPSVLTEGRVRYRDDGSRRELSVEATGAFAANQPLVLYLGGVPTYTMIASAIPGSVTFTADTQAGAAVPAVTAGESVQIWSDNGLFAFGYGFFS